MRSNANWARIVVALFTMAMFHASVCSANCAIGVCPDQVKRTASHGCEQLPVHHSDHSGRKAPDSPDCSRHLHPMMVLTKSGDIAKLQLSFTDQLPATTVAVSKHDFTASLIHVEASDFAPPLASNVPLYQQISVLRI